MEKLYWPIPWIILFAGIIYVNAAVPQQERLNKGISRS